MLPIELASLLLAAIIPSTSAQTFSDCKDNLPSCKPDKAQNVANFNTKFSKGTSPPPGWNQVQCQGKTDFADSGVGFTVAASGDCPALQTDAYYLFGLIEVKMKAAPGQGIVSSIVMESDALDEVDWEFIGGEDFRVQSNYFGKGDTSTYDRMVYVPITDPQNQWHTYSVNWTSSAITWLVDGVAVRTLLYADAKGGTRFPQTPMRLKVGIWAGGDPTKNLPGTVTWAGGNVDYSKGPFSMYVESINIVNYSPADTYTYKDNSGTWQSINVIGGNAGGIVSPDQVSSQQAAATSSTFTASTGSPVPVQPLSGTSTGSSSSAATTSAPAGNSTVVTPTKGSSTSSAGASKSSGPAKVSANAAPGNGVAGTVSGSALLALLLAVFA